VLWRVTIVLLLAVIAAAVVACSGPENSDATVTSPAAMTATASATPVATATPSHMHHILPTETATVTATSVAATGTAPAIATVLVPATATPEAPTATALPTEIPPTAMATATPPVVTATSTPQPSDEFITIRTADTTERIVALTFDAGADRGYAEQILDTLRDEGVVATFGMTGHWAEQNPDLIQRMVDEGHMLMNHTMTHRSWTGYSPNTSPLTSSERADELRRTEEIIAGLTGYELRPYFRPPYGDYDDSVIADLQANGYSVNVMWTVDSLGWAGRSAGEITQRVIAGNVPGAIHLFHVGAQSQDAAALPDIIRQLRDQGYRFVTIAEMVGR
jgi:peptidoglycan-N-acetylglucosamine deacetylase